MKFRLLENVLDSTGDGFLYINPSTNELRSKEDSKWNRGIIDPKGNLYIEAKWLRNEEQYEESLGDYLYSEWTHTDLLDALHSKNKFKEIDCDWFGDKNSLNDGIFVQRYMDTLDFYLAESYIMRISPKMKQKIQNVFDLCKKKNPYLNFYTKKMDAKGYGTH